MLFAPDTIDGLTFTVLLVNTVAGANASGTDELSTPAQLTALLDENRYSGRFDRDQAELDAVRSVRARFRTLWMGGRDDIVGEINAMLRENEASPQLVRHDGLDWHLHAVPLDAPLAARIMVESAMALMDVVRSGATDRMRECEAFDCDGLLLDLSKNGSKRFCSVRCGNRMNMIAWRERNG